MKPKNVISLDPHLARKERAKDEIFTAMIEEGDEVLDALVDYLEKIIRMDNPEHKARLAVLTHSAMDTSLREFTKELEGVKPLMAKELMSLMKESLEQEARKTGGEEPKFVKDPFMDLMMDSFRHLPDESPFDTGALDFLMDYSELIPKHSDTTEIDI
ncbi:MAG: hypothetical protein FWF59_05850 [Turicibacter sp.]|nr:hypothetical protein [Turicibacter sp.]